MAYKLAEEDKLCGIEYPTYEGYKPIPKATCEMLETQCGGIEVVFNCEKKKEEDKPKPKPDEPTPKPEPKPEPNPEEPKPQPNPDEPTPDNPVEPHPEEPKPEEPTPNFDELIPNLEPFSTVFTNNGQVNRVSVESEEDRRAYEDKIINDLKAKLPEGTTVEAVLEGPKYEGGSEVIQGKTNYDLNVRITKNGKVYEHKYKVPHTEREEPGGFAPVPQ